MVSKFVTACEAFGSGYHFFEGTCYFFNTMKKSWEDAKKDCKTKFNGMGKLFEPKTLAINKKVHKMAVAVIRNGLFWIGVNDMNQENKFISESSGQEVAFTWWSPGQPDNSNDEDCVEIWFHDNYRWNDNKCDGKNPFVCQMPTNQ